MSDGKESVHKGHRQRVKHTIKEHGIDTFQDHQILEALLFYSVANGDTNPAAHRLLERFGSFCGVINADYDELCSVMGVGENSALLINLVRMIASKYVRESCFSSDGQVFESTAMLKQYFEGVYIGCKSEKVYALALDDNLKFLRQTVLSEGSADKVPVSPRMILDFVIKNNCSRVVLAHNHPNGSCLPSREDVSITTELASSLNKLEVELVDHIIVGKDGSFSMRNSNHSARIWGIDDIPFIVR